MNAGGIMLRVVTTGVLCLGILLLQPCVAVGQRVIYVDIDAVGTNNGTSWQNAFATLRDALATADSTSEIWIAEGIYHPDRGENVSRGSRTASFDLHNGVDLYGGFAGTESRREERDPETHRVVLSGDLEANDANGENRSENSFNVVTCASETENSVIEGVEITSGHADGDAKLSRGGGIYATECDLTLREMLIHDSFASHSGGGALLGPGTYKLDRVTVESSHATVRGGAIACISCAMMVRDSRFISNNVTGSGGAIYDLDFDSNDITVIDSDFISNTTERFGGATYHSESSPTFINVRFVGNEARYSGGAVSVDASGSPTIINSLFSGNRCQNVIDTIECTGGAAWLFGGDPQIINSTLIHNEADDGGAVFLDSPADGRISNSIFWQNKASAIGDQIHIRLSPGAVTGPPFSHNLIEGGVPPSGEDEGGNIDTNPEFVDIDGADDIPGTLDDDLHLRNNSPAIDSGRNQELLPDRYDLDLDGDTTEALPVDLDYAERIHSGASTKAVDLGVYEFGSPRVDLSSRIDCHPSCRGDTRHHGNVYVYPNPSRGAFRLAFGEFSGRIVEVILYDVLGRELSTPFTGYAPAYQILALREGGVPPGLYYLLIKSQDGSTVIPVVRTR